MDIQNNSGIYGIPNGIYYGQFERTDELNERMYDRFFPDQPLQANFDPRPVPTKYALFPIIDRRAIPNEKIAPQSKFNIEQNFNPGNSRAPPQGFLSNVDIETNLRNQYFALQHGADQGVYVPSSNSDLYKTTVVSKPSVQPHPDLFSKPQLVGRTYTNVEDNGIGKDRFFNHTRTQLRNM
uniref:Uncharacterized protein n=1 Tax=viral metagenome TaxID=1070528 RepID=A0A6C0ERK9_9ZZZZ